jgi:hypothetical protein
VRPDLLFARWNAGNGRKRVLFDLNDFPGRTDDDYGNRTRNEDTGRLERRRRFAP